MKTDKPRIASLIGGVILVRQSVNQSVDQHSIISFYLSLLLSNTLQQNILDTNWTILYLKANLTKKCYEFLSILLSLSLSYAHTHTQTVTYSSLTRFFFKYIYIYLKSTKIANNNIKKIIINVYEMLRLCVYNCVCIFI